MFSYYRMCSAQACRVVYTVAIERETRHLVIGEGALVALAAALRMHIVDKEVCVCVCVCVCECTRP